MHEPNRANCAFMRDVSSGEFVVANERSPTTPGVVGPPHAPKNTAKAAIASPTNATCRTGVFTPALLALLCFES